LGICNYTTNLSCYKQSTVGTPPSLASGPLAAAPRRRAPDAAAIALDTGLARHTNLAHRVDLDDGQANDSDHDLAVSLAVLLPPVRNLVFVQRAADGVDLASSRLRHRQHLYPGLRVLWVSSVGARTEAVEGCLDRTDLVVVRRGLACWVAVTFLRESV